LNPSIKGEVIRRKKRGRKKKKKRRRKRLWLRCKKSTPTRFQIFNSGLALVGLEVRRKKNNSTNYLH
jgi:hypothetical protein